MAHRDALGIPVEFQNNEVACFFHGDRCSVFLEQVLRVACTFQSVRKRNHGLVAINANNGCAVRRTNGENRFKDLPWILLQLLVAEAHSTLLLIQF